MSHIDNEKASTSSKDATDVKVSTTTGHADLYDPSKEHWMTRAGLNFESYKRAPGTTAYVSRACLETSARS